MKALIAIAVIVAVLFVGWKGYVYWDEVKTQEMQKKAETPFSPQQLPGMPTYQMESTLDTAQRNGANGLRDWLKAYGALVKDPRKAWIELDYASALYRENPAEAKKIYQEVKQRSPHTGKLWQRIEELSKTYE